MDALTKYTVNVPCTKESSGADRANMLKDHLHVHLGRPEHVLSDRGTQFTDTLNQVLAERLGYNWKLTTAHAP